MDGTDRRLGTIPCYDPSGTHTHVQGDVRRADRADLDEPDWQAFFSSPGARDQQALGALSPKVVDHDVYPCANSCLKLSSNAFSSSTSGIPHVGAERRDRLERVGVAGGRDDLRGAQMPGDLDGEPARRPGRAVDQHSFAGLKFGAVHIGRPRRHAGIGDRRGGHVIEIVWKRQAARRRGHGSFGHAAVGRAREQEIDAASVITPPDAIDADHEGELAG